MNQGADKVKKSKQSKNKGVVFNLSKNNTKVKINSLGDIELKYVFYGDTTEIAKLLTQKISDKDFVLKVLFRQLLKPKIQLSDFEKITDKELKKLAKAFVRKANYISKHFQDTGDFFKDFRQAIQTDYDKQLEQFLKTFGPRILDYKKKEFLLQNGWVFSPYLSGKKIKDELDSDDILKRKNSEINIIYETFFVENNYSELKNMIKSWKKNQFFKKRINIFNDSLVILQTYNLE